MAEQSLVKSAVLMLIVVLTSVFCWEYFLRNKGYVLGYNDDEALWAKNRAQVYAPQDDATVFIGSSRIKFDLDIPTWEKTTGEKAIQLAIAGSNPRLALDNLANDEKFKGKLIIDITEVLFFRPVEDAELTKRLKYLKEVTPSQKFSAQVGFGLESQFLFIDKEHFALDAMLNELPITNRKGVHGDVIWPTQFTTTNFRRQERMTDKFVKDTSMQRQVKNIWTMFGALSKQHGVTGDTLQKIFTEIQTDVAKIKARGGRVIFTRTPSSGGYWENEPISYPRAEYYDKLLSITGCSGIHFKDYPDLKDFTCPEWSHLKPTDAALYTAGLIKILDQQKWFTHSN
ncbi:hypothetical protein GALL_64420 [mine drainage metagenome]|uniref:Uncharacterized protein n=1 Tax=mine drainage metagenome TaxID=410659 RepID=A0A1J5TJI5_9ZZZZ